MPNYKDLQLELTENVIPVEFNGQTINVKTFLPLQKKMEVISEIINRSGDDQGFYNTAKFDFNFDMEMIKAYTDIKFDDGTDAMQVYDELIQNELFGLIFSNIPSCEFDFIYNNAKATIDQIYKYRNSVYGILDAMKTDYSDLDLDIETLRKNLADDNNVGFLKEVLDKMG